MAQLTYKTLKEWGTDTFCVQDYVGYVNIERKMNSNIPRVRVDEKFAGMVIFNNDNQETISSFIAMCKIIKPSIICVDFSNVDDKNRDFLDWVGNELNNELVNIYIDLNSYENRFCMGLDTYFRCWDGDECHSLESEFVQVED